MHFYLSSASKPNDRLTQMAISLITALKEKCFFFDEKGLAYFLSPSTPVIFKNLIFYCLLLLCFHTDPSCCVKFLINPCARPTSLVPLSLWLSFLKISFELIKSSELFSIVRCKHFPFQRRFIFLFVWAQQMDARWIQETNANKTDTQ